MVAVGVGAALGGAAERAARADAPSDTAPPNCLDQSIKDELGRTLRPRGVQKRPFTKDDRIQLVARGGLFAADLFSTSYIYGGAAAYWLTEDLGLEVSFDATPIALDLDGPVADFFGDDRFESPGTGYLALGGLLWSPIHAKMKIGGSIVHSDVMFALGAGRLFHDTVQGITFDAGMAIELFASRFVTVRLDLRDVIAVQEAVAETRLTNNLVASLGLSLWTPAW